MFIRCLLLIVAVIASQQRVVAIEVDFAHDVVPILRQHCVKCHGGGEAKGGFSINTRELFLDGDAAEPGDAANSHFLELIRSPTTSKNKCRPKSCRVCLLRSRRCWSKWVDAGMPWTEASRLPRRRTSRRYCRVKSNFRDRATRTRLTGSSAITSRQQNLPELEPVDDADFSATRIARSDRTAADTRSSDRIHGRDFRQQTRSS